MIWRTITPTGFASICGARFRNFARSDWLTLRRVNAACSAERLRYAYHFGVAADCHRRRVRADLPAEATRSTNDG